jgi:hypothetical protein
MLRKTEAYTVITPIPGFIPRRLAIDILHSHSEIITLNPLVLSHKAIPTPANAAADEYQSTWYEITERLQVVPGIGRVGSKQIVFNVCFQNTDWGTKSHAYAPLNIDMRIKYRVAGNQPGIEPPAVNPESGGGAGGGGGRFHVPTDGLYLREDIEIRCNISLVSMVKSGLKAASKEMIHRFIHKAELLDAGALQAMMTADGRLKTLNPNDRSQAAGQQHQKMNGSALPAVTSPPPPSYQQQHGQYGQQPGQYGQQHGQYGQQHGQYGQHTGPGGFPPPDNKYPASPDSYNQFNQQQQQQQQWTMPPRDHQFSPQPMEFPAMELPAEPVYSSQPMELPAENYR